MTTTSSTSTDSSSETGPSTSNNDLSDFLKPLQIPFRGKECTLPHIRSQINKLLEGDIDSDGSLPIITCKKKRIYYSFNDKLHIKEIKLNRKAILGVRKFLYDHSLIPQRLTDHQIMEYLYLNDYNVESTGAAIISAYEIKSMAPDFFEDRNPFTISNERAWDMVSVAVMPNLSRQGYRLMFIGFRTSTDNTELFDIYSALRLYTMIFDILLQRYSFSDYIIFFDASEIMQNHLQPQYVILLHRFLIYLMEAAPLRMKHLYIVNPSDDAGNLMSTMFNFLNFLLLSRMTIIQHNVGKKPRELKKMSNNLLPMEFGGNLSLKKYQNYMKHYVKSMSLWFIDEEAQREEAKASSLRHEHEYLFDLNIIDENSDLSSGDNELLEEEPENYKETTEQDEDEMTQYSNDFYLRYLYDYTEYTDSEIPSEKTAERQKNIRKDVVKTVNKPIWPL